MKKLFNVLTLWTLLLGASCAAQTTAVGATVVDTDGTTWANGSWSVQFVPNPSQPNIGVYNINGTPLSPSVLNQSGVLNGSGVLAVSVYRQAPITPVGSAWKLTICPNAVTACGTYVFIAIGSSQDLSSALTPVIPAPRFAPVAGTYGYNDTEAILQLKPGSTYWNVTSSLARCYNGSAWGVCSAPGTSEFPITIGSTSIAALSTTTSIIGLTLDGVTPTTFGFVDPTSSIQTQLNGKASSTAFTTVNSQVCTLGSSCTIAAAPSGSSGGDLTGTYPNPTLTAIGIAGSCGDATHVCQPTFDTKGRETAHSDVAITFPTGPQEFSNVNGSYIKFTGGSIWASGTCTVSFSASSLGTCSITWPNTGGDAFSSAPNVTFTAMASPSGANDSITSYSTGANTSGAIGVVRCSVNIGGSGCPSSMTTAISAGWTAVGHN